MMTRAVCKSDSTAALRADQISDRLKAGERWRCTARCDWPHTTRAWLAAIRAAAQRGPKLVTLSCKLGARDWRRCCPRRREHERPGDRLCAQLARVIGGRGGQAALARPQRQRLGAAQGSAAAPCPVPAVSHEWYVCSSATALVFVAMLRRSSRRGGTTGGACGGCLYTVHCWTSVGRRIDG